MSTCITETCGCGATFAVTAAYASYAERAATTWRSEHRHDAQVAPGAPRSAGPDSGSTGSENGPEIEDSQNEGDA